MNTEHPAALGAGPSCRFAFYEMPYAEVLYMQEVVDHTHAVVGPIALIQVEYIRISAQLQ